MRLVLRAAPDAPSPTRHSVSDMPLFSSFERGWGGKRPRLALRRRAMTPDGDRHHRCFRGQPLANTDGGCFLIAAIEQKPAGLAELASGIAAAGKALAAKSAGGK